MATTIIVKGKPMIINKDAIERDISLLEKMGKVGRYEDGVYMAPRPNLHGMLTCLRNKKYDPASIESACLESCPHPERNNPIADDRAHLDDCWDHMFNSVSLDGKTKYVEYDY